MNGTSFTFKQFEVRQDMCAMKVGTDGVLLGAWAAGGSRILDIGTGTGLIALMMAQRYVDARVCAIDIDPDACRQASANVAASPFAGRVTIENVRLQDFDDRQQYDCIVSNPPFYDDSLKCPDTKRSTARHTSTLAYAELFAGVGRLLAADGVFSAVVPTDVEAAFSAEASFVGLMTTRRCAVRTVARKQPKRVLLEFARCRRQACATTIETLVDADGGRSEWYRALTDAFYLK